MSASIDMSKLLAGLGEMRQKGLEAAKKAMIKLAWHTIGDSQALCPVDTGALAASGTIGELVMSGDSFYVEIGHNVEYAAAVHEVLTARHPQGQAKYLETAIRNNAPKMEAFIGGEIKKAIG